MNYINFTVQYYLYLLLLALIYKLIFVLRLFSLYESMAGSNPVVLLGYISFLHSFGVAFLYYSLYYDAKFYIVFLALNGVWMGAVAIGFIIGITDVWKMDRFKDDPLNHMVVFVTFTLAALLELLVYLHRNTRIASREPELVHKKDERKSKSSKKPKPKSREADNAASSNLSTTGVKDKPSSSPDGIAVTEPKEN